MAPELAASGRTDEAQSQLVQAIAVFDRSKMTVQLERAKATLSRFFGLMTFLQQGVSRPFRRVSTWAIPEPIRNQLISKNLRSAKPLPMVVKWGENVDGSHDLHVKKFVHNGRQHIGLHMLCPNTSLKK